MARTYPPTLLPSDVKSKGEEKVFAALRDGLDDGWEVFHSAGLVYRDPATGATDDECDFVLCHADRAIIVIEVKGGGIQCRYGEWFRVGRDKGTERMPDPFQRVVDHTWSLRKKIDELDGW